MNAEIIKALTELKTFAEILAQNYQALAYARAIRAVRLSPPLKSAADIVALKAHGVGTKILDKLREFITTGRIEELEQLRRDPKIRAWRELGGIVGVGPATIEKWYDMKIRSMADLRRAVDTGQIKLTKAQKYGVEFYDDLNSRIPRDEVTMLGDLIKQYLLQLDPDIVFEIAGSYRRGLPTSGDIDILVSNRHHFDANLLRDLVESLQRHDPNFIDTLALGVEKVTILYRSPTSNKVRQLDVLNIAYNSYYAALNYFTGSAEHNEWLRGLAKSRGYRLNQHGLYRIVDARRPQLNELIPLNSESELYRLLGVEYIPPESR